MLQSISHSNCHFSLIFSWAKWYHAKGRVHWDSNTLNSKSSSRKISDPCSTVRHRLLKTKVILQVYRKEPIYIYFSFAPERDKCLFTWKVIFKATILGLNCNKASMSFYERLQLQYGFVLGRVQDDLLPQCLFYLVSERVTDWLTLLHIGVPIKNRLHEF